MLIAGLLAAAADRARGQAAPTASSPASSGTPGLPALMLGVEGTNVWVERARTRQREAAFPSQVLELNDHGYTGARSRATVRLMDLSIARIGELSDFVIKPPPDSATDGEFSLLRGLLYLLHRDRPGSHRFTTPVATAATRGTEFTLEVDAATGRTTLTVLEGEAELRNDNGTVLLARGEQGIATLGQPPTRTAVIDTTNVVQWCLYYPAVLDLSELELGQNEEEALSASLAAWRAGDLLQAVAAYPAARPPGSDLEQIYTAALLLAVGQVPSAEARFTTVIATADPGSRPARLAAALRELIQAVKLRPTAVNPARRERGTAEEAAANAAEAPLATESLAASYRWQALGNLEEALHAAHAAWARSPQFSFAAARVAELEFSLGRTAAAARAVQAALRNAPRNAQAHALQGFLLAAQARTGEARAAFDEAIALDSGLGNAWLGRGLCRVREGQAAAGRFDLEVAAALEPHRSLLRSYLGKAFSNSGDRPRATRELEIARQIDPADPTPWLYSALLLQQENRLNEAVRDLEQSKDLNDNRRLYRSRLLLDQDRAVRAANLAAVYRDAGLKEVSAREAGRAVNADYINDASHRFLANSFNELRDPKRINLRYETATTTEFLLANLLSPVGAGALSAPVSQQEYGRLFDRDRVGVTATSDYRSSGDWAAALSHYGQFGRSAYSLDGSYEFDNGHRPNNELEQWEASVTFKQQLSPTDTVFVQASQYQLESGDVRFYYDWTNANPRLRVKERLPAVIAGYHHEWGPGSHTLALFSRLDDKNNVSNPLHTTLFFNRGFGGPIGTVAPLGYNQDYASRFEVYAGELQQIWQRQDHTLILGARFQGGSFLTRNREIDGQIVGGPAVSLTLTQRVEAPFERESVYAYDQWQILDSLLLAGGLTYDHLRYPDNFRYAPVARGTAGQDQLSPKAGLIYTPTSATTARAAYSRGLGGAGFDQSYRIEPSQIAGFNQAYRSLIPESVAGSLSAATFDAGSFSLEQRLGRQTYLGVSGELLSSEADRQQGVVVFSVPSVPGPALSAQQTRQTLDFEERSLFLTVNQLIGEEWSLGARYRLSQAELATRYPGIPATAAPVGGFRATENLEATLHQLELSAVYNHRSGFFAGLEAIWTRQHNQGYSPSRPGDEFWQFNLEAGWRFLRRRLEARVALLNLADQNYHLNPLNLTTELPRERTLALRLQLNF